MTATDLLRRGRHLEWQRQRQRADATVSFEYGLTDAYGSQVAAIPGTVAGNTATPTMRHHQRLATRCYLSLPGACQQRIRHDPG